MSQLTCQTEMETDTAAPCLDSVRGPQGAAQAVLTLRYAPATAALYARMSKVRLPAGKKAFLNTLLGQDNLAEVESAEENEDHQSTSLVIMDKG